MPHLQIDLTGKRALVTGGGRGIGQAIAKALARCGADVAVNYRTDQQSAQQTVDEILRDDGRACAIQADVSIAEEVKKLFSAIEERFGDGLDILINNAGGLERMAVDQMSEELWDRNMAVNAKSVFLCTQAAWSRLPDSDGRIVNVTSIAARNGGVADSIHYAAAKAAVSTFTRGCAKALAPRGITVNGIAPGVIYTDFHKRNTSQQALERVLSNIPLGRLGDADDCAGAVLLLCSPQASYVTGEIIEINGGLHMD